MQNNINLELESYLELIALRFLNIVGEEGHYEESLSLANELIENITKNKNDIFNSIPATGNYGIALHSILSNNLINETSEKLIVRLVSYWAISNHLNHDDIPLLRYNRAIGLYSDRKLFYETYKKTLASETNSMVYQAEISSIENTVNMLFMYDLYLIKDYSTHFNQVFQAFEAEFDIPPFGFNSKNYYTQKNQRLMNVIKNGLLSAI
jgi:DNA-binding XRE family transcriptional regulator